MSSSFFRLSPIGREVLQRYQGLSRSARLFLSARWRWTPYEQIASHVPTAGTVLDFGAGHGLLSLAMKLSAPDRIIRGIDHDAGRVDIARRAAAGLANIEFQTGTLESALAEQASVAGIVVIDAMHYLTLEAQERFVRRAWEVLAPGGVLLIRDVDADAGGTFFINRLHEKIMTGLGFTRADRLHFRTQAQWQELLTGAGFECAHEKCSRFPFADRLFRCRRLAQSQAMAA